MVVQTILRRFAQMTGAAYCLMLIMGSAQAIDLRRDLSEAQFKAAGLSKLESAELDELQRLIDAKPEQSPRAIEPVASKPALAATESSPDWRPAPAESERKIIETEVTEEFKGLFGNSRIKLANGQVWQQTDRAVFDRKLRDKRVRINPAMLGSWRLQFKDNNLTFSVKRVE